MQALQATGVDISESSIDFARKQCADLNNVDFQVNSVSEIVLEDNYYSKVVCLEVIEHLIKDEIDRLISKSYKTLKPGGLFLITTPNYYSLWAGIEYLMDKFKLSPPMVGHQHITKFNMSKLKNWLNSFKFQITDTGGFNTITPWVGFLPEKFIKRLNRIELNHISLLGNLIYIIARKPTSNSQ